MTYHCLLFDLDGTLIDSKADIATSINLMLNELGQASLSLERVLGFVGEGMRLLVGRALQASLERVPQEQETDRALEVYLRHYSEHLLDQTYIYPEVEETLAAFAHLPKAIVTNKPYDFTVTLLERLNLLSHFAVVLGGDSLPERKPAPLPLLEAATRCEVTPDHCLMIGDSRFDILAGRAAGMKTCGYVAGFRGKAELVEAGADLLIERFGELRQLVNAAS